MLKLCARAVDAAVLGVVLLLGLRLAASGQTVPPPAQSPAPTTSSDAAPKVILLPPQVIFDQLSAASHIRDLGPDAFQSTLIQVAASELAARKYTTITPESLNEVDAAELLKQLQPLTSRLARGSINDEAQQTLKYLAAFPNDYLLLVQFIRITEGPGASWNSFTGAITSPVASTMLQSALISTRTGKVIWKNDMLERKILRPNDPKFTKSVSLIYKTLEPK